jgi:hypothetical protein
LCAYCMNLAVIVLSPICAAAGFMLKLYVDKFTEHKLMVKERKVKDLEYKLREFYCPLYTNLKTETIISGAFVNVTASNVVFELEQFVLKAHVENQAIIRTHMVNVNPDKTIQKLLTEYSDHITIYKLIHDVAPDDFVLNFTKKVAYPKELFGLIETELTVLRAELDTLHNSIV